MDTVNVGGNGPVTVSLPSLLPWSLCRCQWFTSGLVVYRRLHWTSFVFATMARFDVVKQGGGQHQWNTTDSYKQAIHPYGTAAATLFSFIWLSRPKRGTA